MKTITVIGRRWFEKVNGNTYHSVNVYADGDMIGREPFTYGYGDMYLQSAMDILEKARITAPEKYENGGRESLWKYCDRTGIKLVYEVSDVKRKKDL